MAGQGCINEGHDHRFNPFGITCYLQRMFSFKSNIPPPIFVLDGLGIRVYIPLTQGRTLYVHASLFRYDWNAHVYIFNSFAAKVLKDRIYPLYL